VEKIWLKNYAKGLAEEINADRSASLMHIFEESVSKYANKTAFINMGQSLTYSELDKQSRFFAACLQSRGMKKGDAVAVMMPNLLQYPIALFGILRAGLVVVNVNPMYTNRELKHQLNDSGAKAIVIVENFAHTLAEVIQETPVETVITTQIGDLLPVPKRWLVNFVIKNVKKMVPDFSLPQAINFNAVLREGQRANYTRPELTGEDLAFLQYTGGTTGVSKGAMLTHRNMVGNLEQVSGLLELVIEEGNEMIVTALPLYHIFALTANCLTFLKYGCQNLLITNPRDMEGFVKELSKHPFTMLTGVNTLFNGLLNTTGFHELDFRRLKLSLGGGAAVQKPVAERWAEVTGVVLLEGYGLTECSPVVTVNPPDLEKYKGSIGIPLPSTEIRLLDDDGNEVASGESGEMYVRGPQVMLGYLNRPEATQEILQDGWLATGDVARCDDDGYFYIVDRKKDMILVSGFNVFPNEIEEVAAMMDEIVEAAAVGVPHEVSGEVVKLFVVSSDKTLKQENVIDHCRQHLTGYKVPKLVEFRDELPKTNVGKILRRELR